MDLFPAWSKVKIKAERGKLPTFMSRARQAAENLKPAAFDPRSVDIDNDGWHQEGTTARWFGVGTDNPLFKKIKKAFEGLDSEDEETLMAAAERAEDMWGAPDPLSSYLEADISWIGGWQTQYGRGAPISDVAIESAARAIRGRELLRDRGKRLSDIPDAEEIDVPETADAIEISKDIEESAKKAKATVQEFDSTTVEKMSERKKRDELLRESAKDYISDDTVDAAKSFDPEEYDTVSEDDNSERYSDWLSEYQTENPEPDYADYESDDEYAVAYDDWQSELDDAWDVFKSEGSDSESEIDTESLHQAVAELFDFEFDTLDGKSYSVKLNEVVHDAGGDISLTVDFFDSSGRHVGFATRTLDLQNKTVSHDILRINENNRGSGMSTVFNARNELLYAALGIENIEVSARSSADGDYNGVTHWPKVGFDWSEESDRAEFLDKVKDALNDYYAALKKNPDEVPTIKVKQETLVGGVMNVDFVDVPMFSSPQEAEQLSQMLLEAMGEDFDDPKRLTAAEFVNWYGAEAYFKKGNGTNATYKRTVGQETKEGRIRQETSKAAEDVGKATESTNIPNSIPEPPVDLQTSFKNELKEAESGFSEELLANPKFAKFLNEFKKIEDDSFYFSNDNYDPVTDVPYISESDLIGSGLKKPSFSDSTMQEDIEFIFKLYDYIENEDGYNEFERPGPMAWVLDRQRRRRKQEIYSNAKPDGVSDFASIDKSISSKSLDSVSKTEINPVVTPEDVVSSEKKLANLQKKMMDHFTRMGAEWRHLTYTSIDGEEVSIVRGGELDDAACAKAAIAHNLGKFISEQCTDEEMQRFILSEFFKVQSQENLDRQTENFGTPEGQTLNIDEDGIGFVHGSVLSRRTADERREFIDSSSEAYSSLLGEYIASNLVSSWASTSQGGYALSIQAAAKRLFGQGDDVRMPTENEHVPTPRSMTDPTDVSNKIYDSFARGQYEATQQMFKDAGITEIVAHRGMGLDPESSSPIVEVAKDSVIEISDAEVELNPLSSTAYGRDVAFMFAAPRQQGGVSTVVQATTPVDRIFSTALTGLGCLNEKEMVFIGGGDTRFNLSAYTGANLQQVLSDRIVTKLDRFRPGDVLSVSRTERLTRAGYSEDEISKINDYMSRRDLSVLPSLSDIKRILDGTIDEYNNARAM